MITDPYRSPYIGITDFTNADQAAAMRKILDDEGCKHLLHVGAMMSYKTLRGHETKWSGAYPPKEALKDIFVKREGVLNILHYADYDNVSTVDDLIEALDWAGPDVDGIQLDMPWPDPDMLSALWSHRLNSMKDTQFILQISQKAIEEVDESPMEVAKMLMEYRRKSCLDYALFDMSGGRGIPLNSVDVLSYLWVSLNMVPELEVAVAGGLGPTTMHLAEPIVRDLSRNGSPISFDAQSKLRASGNAMDPIDWNMAGEYVRQGAVLLKKCSASYLKD